MKAAESTMNFNEKLKDYTQFAVDGIAKICKEIGPRYCGSPAEAAAQRYLRDEYRKYADDARIETFSVHPAGLVGTTKVCAVLLAPAIVCAVCGLHAAVLALAVLAFLTLILEFGLYKEFIDFLFPKRTSSNCIALRKAAGETKRRIIIAGHMDSSPEWHPTYYGGRFGLFFVFIYAFAGLLFLTALSVMGLALGGENAAVGVMRWISLAFLPSYVLLFLFSGKPMVEGANDNLSGVYCAAAVMKYMADNDLRLENTDLICMATGGEESGLRGTKAYMKAHAPQFRSDGIETVFIAVDTIRDYDCQYVYAKDMSGITKHDPGACRLVQKAGELSGVKLDFSSVYLGSSDAAAATQAGVKATAYAAMDPGPPRYYHTRLDTWENLRPETIEKGIEILINTVFLFDEQGLKTPETGDYF